VGRVVAINIALPISASEKGPADCRANFGIVAESLNGVSVVATNVNVDRWKQIEKFFNGVVEVTEVPPSYSTFYILSL
jgi:hypothetical protein